MPSVPECQVYLTDSEGRVTSVLHPHGGPSSEEAMGRFWYECASHGSFSNGVPDLLSDRAASFSLIDEKGKRVVLEAYPFDNGHHLVLLRPESFPEADAGRQRMVSQSELAAGVAHEINKALTLVSGRFQMLGGETAGGISHNEVYEMLEGEIDRIGRLTRELLNFARGSLSEKGHVEVNKLLDQILGLVSYQYRNQNIEVVADYPPDLPPLCGVAGKLKQAFLNLITNARNSMPSGGRLTVKSRVNGKWMEVSISDTGCGIPEGDQERIFSPYYTTRTSQGGTGLGLPVCRQVVDEHGGELHLESAVGEGSTFTVRLPLKEDSKDGPPESGETG